MTRAGLRILALPAARLGAYVFGLVAALGVLGGAIRTLPVLLAPGIALELLPVVARGVVAVAIETALVVAPPIAFAAASAGIVARGELRALAALGVRPGRVLASAWPVVCAFAAAAAVAGFAWGQEAQAPGRLVRALSDQAREACRAQGGVSEIPLLGATWVCLEGEPPRVVALALGGVGATMASTIDVSDDLRTVRLRDATIVVRAQDDRPELRVRAVETTVTGLLPVLRSSNLSARLRAMLIAVTAAALALAAGGGVLAARIAGRLAATAVGVAGASTALLVFSALERGPAAATSYALVPLAGVGAIAVAVGVARRLHAGGELER